MTLSLVEKAKNSNAILTAAVVLPVILFFGSPEMAARESQQKEADGERNEKIGKA